LSDTNQDGIIAFWRVTGMSTQGTKLPKHVSAFAIEPRSFAAFGVGALLSLVAAAARAGMGLVDATASAYPPFLAAVLAATILAGVEAGIFAAALGVCLAYLLFSKVVPSAFGVASLILYALSSLAIVLVAEHYRHLLHRLRSNEQMAGRHLALVQAENDVLAQIVSEDTLGATLAKLAATIEAYCDAPTVASVMLVEGGRLRVGAAAHLPDAYNRAIEGLEIGPAAGSCGTAAFRKAPVVVSDIATDPLWAKYKQLALPHGLRACWSVPIISSAGDVIGTFAVYHLKNRTPSDDETKIVALLTRIAALAIEHDRDREQRQRAEEVAQRLAAIITSSEDAIVAKDLNGIVTNWNDGAERLFGYAPDEIIGKSIRLLIPPERLHEEDDILARLASGERVEHFETIRQRKDGSVLDVSLTISPIKNSLGEIVGASKIARDISDRKQREAQIRVLAREAEHRAKNILATVLATVHLTNAETPQALKKAIEGRIQALANVHRLFVESRWAGAGLRDVMAQELAPYSQNDDAHVLMDGANILLEPTAAQAMAVCVHELATNAAKYGALSRPGGHISLQWSQAADGRISLRWAEMNGPIIPNPPTRRGFGMQVIERMIKPMKGAAEFDWRADGLVCQISLAA
jgi:PAS domain S-box-containing protein